MMSHVMSDHVDWRSVSEDVIRSSVRMAVPVLACVVGNRGVRSPGSKPKPLLFHPVVVGEEKTGGKIVRLPGPEAAACRLRGDGRT